MAIKRKFKVGDRVIRNSKQKPIVLGVPLISKKGWKGTIRAWSRFLSGGYNRYQIDWDNGEVTDPCEHHIDLFVEKPAKFLLQYELDEDPVEEFETLKQVKKRIKELSERTDLKRDSIYVYEIKSKKKVELVNNVTIKGL